MPSKAESQASWITTSSPRNFRVLPAERADARGISLPTGKFRSCRILIISWPTAPMAKHASTKKMILKLMPFRTSSMSCPNMGNMASQGKTMNTKEKEFLTTLIQIIEQNITDDISQASVAEKLCISEMTLYRRIKELAGKRPSAFIRGIKLSRAAHLLKTTDMTVQEIMFDCGFNNKSYFYRTFSATYGMSPKEYRKAL